MKATNKMHSHYCKPFWHLTANSDYPELTLEIDEAWLFYDDMRYLKRDRSGLLNTMQLKKVFPLDTAATALRGCFLLDTSQNIRK